MKKIYILKQNKKMKKYTNKKKKKNRKNKICKYTYMQNQ